MKRFPESPAEIMDPKSFIEGETILTCPSDGTNIKWRVEHVAPDGTVFAQADGNQQLPSLDYPTEIEIKKDALSLWKKVE